MITNNEQLEEVLSRPTPADVEAMEHIGGDLLILGAAGKMGPSLALRAKRAIVEAGVSHRVIAVSRFSDPAVRKSLEDSGVQPIPADLMDRDAVQQLPDAPNIIFMAGRKFGTQGAQHETWAANVLVPALAAERYRGSRIVVFSSGNVYPFRKVKDGGAWEATETDPVGEYAQTVRGRERVFEYFASTFGTKSGMKTYCPFSGVISCRRSHDKRLGKSKLRFVMIIFNNNVSRTCCVAFNHRWYDSIFFIHIHHIILCEHVITKQIKIKSIRSGNNG